MTTEGLRRTTKDLSQDSRCPEYEGVLTTRPRRSITSSKPKKAKAAPLHATKALGGRGVQLLLILDLGIRWGWMVSVTPRQRFSPGKGPPVPFVQEAGWSSEPVWKQEATGKILSPLLGIEPLSPGRPARSQTLYWLSYPGSSSGNVIA
jgi:hypothetical protein